MSPIVKKTLKHVELLLKAELPDTCYYHNFRHTERVFKSTKEIIENSLVSEREEEILLLASLLHDIGYIKGNTGHEERSSTMASEFLSKNEVSEKVISEVAKCIMATKMGVTPSNTLEKILRDADSSHFAKDYFEEASEFLRKEFQEQGVVTYDKGQWLKENIAMLSNKHEYYTDYAIKNWTPKKEANIQKMMEEQTALKQEKKESKKKLKEKAKAQDPEKAIQSVFRVTLKNHIKLSDIADTKANILLSVNAIIISIALSNLIPKLDNPSNTYLIYPTVIFLIFTVISIVLSVLATRPNVTSGKFSKQDVDDKKVNLLFFGNFHKMSLTEFEWAMNEMLQDKEYMYSSMTKDLYFLGLVLQRKYSILRLTYTIFMIGIIVSVAAFALSFRFFGETM